MPSLSLSATTLIVLLATTILLAKALPLNSTDEYQNECQNECQVYKSHEKMTTPSELNITATLSDLTNNNSYFQSVSPKLALEDMNSSSGGNDNVKACYKNNPTTGCTHNQIVDDDKIKKECTWTYQCDYDQNRIPQYLWKADCNSATFETIYYPVPVLKYYFTCNPLAGSSKWTLVIEKVPVSCACKNSN